MSPLLALVSLLAGALILACMPRLAGAQSAVCDAALLASADNPYGYRLRGDRCEGIYVQRLANTTLHVKSFYGSFERFDAASGDDLQVQWTAPRDAVVHVRAQGLKRRLYYRMDTVRPAGSSSYDWPTGLLGALGIERRDLGVLAWFDVHVNGDRRTIYLPLRIHQGEQQAPSASYQLVLVPGRELAEVYIQLAPVDEDGRLGKFLQSDRALGYGRYPLDRAITIPIGRPEEPGLYYLEIGAELAAGGVAATQLYFRHDAPTRQ